MSPTFELGPWLALAGLGAFHGLNPAMGWLLAVALGMHRASRRAVWLSLVPIALGHATSIIVVLAVVLALGRIVERDRIEVVAGAVLLSWAAYHAIYGHRSRVRVGMLTGMLGLGLWSFAMASAHGAGLMLTPVVIPMCIGESPARDLISGEAVASAFAAVAVHMAAMVAAIAVAAAVVYERVGVAFLRRGWVNLDLLWTIALAATGAFLLL
jgi:hypothetical protein